MTDGQAAEPISVDRTVIVLGAGPEAGHVSRELADLGYRISWITGADGSTPDAVDHPLVTLYCEHDLLAVDGNVGRFTARLEAKEGSRLSVDGAAIVVAIGNSRRFPSERYGVIPSSNVLSVSQVRRQLEAPRATGTVIAHRDQRIFVVLDLEGETPKETATEALVLAVGLRRNWHSEVYVFYQNLKVDTFNLERITRDMRQQGIVFCRYADSSLTATDDGISFTYVEGTLEGDLLVLPEIVAPHPATARLARTLRVRVGDDGYFQDLNIRHYRPGISARKGIYYAGRCHMDADLATLQADASLAAANVDALLGEGYLVPEPIIAHVDSEKCVRCLTCVRTCPHAAIDIVDYETVTAARVEDLACRGCGACVTNCPVQAIELVGQSVPTWATRTAER